MASPQDRPSKRWIGDFRVESEMVLAEETGKKLSNTHPNGSYEVRLSNVADEQHGDETLAAQIIVLALTIDDAAEVTNEQLRQFLHLLTVHL
jgi:hypothetical protein